jgi:NAD(P)-dependent dehydrogenase (short-subunit alcohol dehydrogenase family)
VGVRWRLDGYKVLVTGSTKGIGLATATEMASLGAWIFITARSNDDVQSTVANLQGLYPDQNISGFAADIR